MLDTQHLLLLAILFCTLYTVVQAAIPTAVPAPIRPVHGSTYVNVSQYPGELCNRVCAAGKTRNCYFQFVLEHYQAMGIACGSCKRGNATDCDNAQCIVGDGFEKGVMSINRQVPGPAIHVCRGDYLIVDVVNQAQGTAATLHWHGIHMQDTPYMDGVPFVTQCPIPFANSFRYQFWATEAGTQFYHSHSGHHKVNGQYGALIVRQPAAATLNAANYDYDLPAHHILIADWMHQYAEQYFPGLPGARGIFPDSVLINGRGTYISSTGERTEMPPTRYYVTSGKRYRFRLINSISHACPFQMQIEQHNLTIIASDAYSVEPRPFDTLVSNSGERYDFVLHANHSGGDFWIRVRGLAVCADNPTEAFALLRYKSNDANTDDDQSRPLPPMPAYDDTFPSGIYLNHPNATCFGGVNDHCASELTALDKDELLRNSTPDYQFFLAFQNIDLPVEEIFRPGTYNHFANLRANLTIVGAINNLSLIFPNYPPLTQPWDIDESQFCNEFQWPAHCTGYTICPCIHRLKIALGSIVEFIIVNDIESIGRLHHPFHLHGYRFMVMGMGQDPLGFAMGVETAKELERLHLLPRNTNNPHPPFKDTVSIPSRGFAVVRLRALNPGFWLMHCHYEWHLAIGMGLILQVGKPTEMVAAPPNFPQCRNYLPPVQQPKSV